MSEELEKRIRELERLLAAEQEQCSRMGADNVRRMQRLGVKFPEGLDSGIDRLEKERDQLLEFVEKVKQAIAAAMAVIPKEGDPYAEVLDSERVAVHRWRAYSAYRRLDQAYEQAKAIKKTV